MPFDGCCLSLRVEKYILFNKFFQCLFFFLLKAHLWVQWILHLTSLVSEVNLHWNIIIMIKIIWQCDGALYVIFTFNFQSVSFLMLHFRLTISVGVGSLQLDKLVRSWLYWFSSLVKTTDLQRVCMCVSIKTCVMYLNINVFMQ